MSPNLPVGSLSGDGVSDGINFYPLLHPSLSPIGLSPLIYGQGGRIGESSIVGVVGSDAGPLKGVFTEAQYVKAAGGPDDAFLTGGDSGSPSFILDVDGNLILSGIHSGAGSDDDNNYIYDTYASAYINQLNAIGGLTVTTSLIPEPSTGILLGLSILALSFRRCR